MPKSRDFSLIAATEIGDLLGQLNFILQRINDRLDKLEGLRDSFESDGGGSFGGAVEAPGMSVKDDSESVIHSMGE